MANSEPDSNNIAKGLALREMLKLALEENITNILMHGDSEIRVDFMNGRNILHNNNLQGIEKCLEKLDGDFNTFHIVHIFKEQNCKVDVLSKKGRTIFPRNHTFFYKS